MTIDEMLDRLRRLDGVVVKSGTPMNELEIARAEKQLGLRLPPDYRGFLTTHGSLAVYRDGFDTTIWENTFFAGSPDATLERFEGAAGVVEVSRRVLAEVESSGDEVDAKLAAVLLGVNGVSEAYVLRENGLMSFVDRGAFRAFDNFSYEFDEASPVTFEKFAVDWLDTARRTIEEKIERAAQYEELFEALGKMATAAGGHAGIARNGGRVFVRGDGIEVSLRPGDGNEWHGRACGVFYHWHEPGASVETLNARLHAAHASQRSATSSRVRGLVAMEMPVAEIAWVLEHDTGLRFAGAERPVPITEEDIEAAFARDAKRVLPTFREAKRTGTRTWTFEAGRDESRAEPSEPAATGSAAGALFDFFGSTERKPPPGFAFELRLEEEGAAILETVHRATRELAPDAAAFLNEGATTEPHRHTNLDHERFVVAHAAGDGVVLRRRLHALELGKLDFLAMACRDLQLSITISLKYFEVDRYRANRETWTARERATAAMLAEAKSGRRSETNLEGADFEGQVLTSRRWEGASARRAKFTKANLQFTTFDGSDLRDADFRGADCGGASFVGCDLRGADFTGADLSGASFLFARSGPQFW